MKHILVVEDEINLRESIADHLHVLGYKTVLAKDGIQGYTEAKKDPPALIISDIVMPNVDGFNFLSLVRSDNALKDIPFIFLTAKVERIDRREGMDLGADDFLTKPFTHLELAGALEARLKRFNNLEQKSESLVNSENLSMSVDRLAIPTLDGVNFVLFSDILYGEAKRSYSCFYLSSGKKILVSKALKEFESTLASSFFCRVHRSFIVNMKFVNKYVRGKTGHLVLSNGSCIPVSSSRKSNVMDILHV